MRQDSIGFFWQDVPAPKGERSANRIMPEIPNTGWKAPSEFPRLGDAPWISFDVEGYDPELLDNGPGWGRGKSHLCGISVAVPGAKWYFPMRHEVCPEQNLNPDDVLAWARETLSNPLQPKIGANITYDIGCLDSEGVHVKGPLYDVQYAEALLDESAKVSLDTLGQKYLNKGKETSALYIWSSDYYGGPTDSSQRKNIYRCPPCLVGPYAEEDAALPPRILPLQYAIMQRENLVPVFELECKLIPMLIAMRKAGVSIDLPRAQYVRDCLVENVKGLNKKLREIVGFEVNADANDSLQRAFRHLGLPMPTDAVTGKPSFTKDTLPKVEHEIGDIILTIRKRNKIRSTFIESYILSSHVKGKVHCSIHPLRGDDGGTRSGRFSMSNPNGQNIPSRDEELAPLVRGFFIPDQGHFRWRRYDYEQIEYRFLAHYAVGQGSDKLRQEYNDNPDTDYHVNAQTLVTNFTGIKIPRKPIKNFNFGMTFGMGKGKMLKDLQRELTNMGGSFKLNGDELFTAYHEALPFTRETMDHYINEVSQKGYVSTILGRRSRFDLWEPDVRGKRDEERKAALPYNQALRTYGKIKRAYAHKALNRVLQGSAADLMKKAMLDLWESGVLDYVGVPRLTVHDELDFSDPIADQNDKAWEYVRRTYETAIRLKIPIQASAEIGPDWGHAT